jgi:hypothetical protein
MHIAVNLPIDTTTTSRVIDATRGQVLRLSTRETTGTAAAVFEMYDGSSDKGTLLDTISLSAGQSTRDYYRHWEYPYYGGLYLAVLSGSIRGGVTVLHSDDWDHVGEPVVLVNPEVLALTISS